MKALQIIAGSGIILVIFGAIWRYFILGDLESYNWWVTFTIGSLWGCYKYWKYKKKISNSK